MSPVTAHTHKRLSICYLSYASTLDFVTKTHSFRDKIASALRSKISSQTSTVANYMHLKGGKNSNIFVIICIYVN